MKRVISPLEGEMSGRTEGGVKDEDISGMSLKTSIAVTPSRAGPPTNTGR
jgi:hypothetical protein